MIDYDELTNLEFIVLIAIYEANEGSIHSRKQKENIYRLIPLEYQQGRGKMRKINKAFNRLVSTGLALEQPSGNPTYKITKFGRRIVEENQ